ncbi:Hypothetical protein FKW44_006225, partial [Caligus rogercresseyi]
DEEAPIPWIIVNITNFHQSGYSMANTIPWKRMVQDLFDRCRRWRWNIHCQLTHTF